MLFFDLIFLQTHYKYSRCCVCGFVLMTHTRVAESSNLNVIVPTSILSVVYQIPNKSAKLWDSRTVIKKKLFRWANPLFQKAAWSPFRSSSSKTNLTHFQRLRRKLSALEVQYSKRWCFLPKSTKFKPNLLEHIPQFFLIRNQIWL